MSEELKEKRAKLREAQLDFYGCDGITTKDIHVATAEANSMSRKKLADLCGDREQHLTWSIANDAYRYVLEEGVTAKEALIFAARKNSKEFDLVYAEKSNQSKGLNKSVIKSHKEHPVQVDMQKKGKLRMIDLKNSQNVWQLLNTLNGFVTAYEEVCQLEDAINRLDTLENEMALAKAEIELLKDVTNLSGLSSREKAGILKRKGITQSDIAKVVGVSVSTMKRWWSSL